MHARYGVQSQAARLFCPPFKPQTMVSHAAAKATSDAETHLADYSLVVEAPLRATYAAELAWALNSDHQRHQRRSQSHSEQLHQ